MIVKLKGELDIELKALGLKIGDEVGGYMCKISKVGAFHFDTHKNGETYNCVVWPENYDIVQPVEQPKLPLEYSFETGV